MKKNRIQIIASILFVMAFAGVRGQAMFPEVTVNLAYPQYQRLKMDGGFVYIDGAGLKGIILYRANENSYLAFERACPHHPAANCVVQVDGSTLFMIDHCCRSTFNFSDGMPTGGPAERPLLQYRTELSGTVLKISDEVVN